MEWLLPPDVDLSPELLVVAGGHPLVARLLAQRGFADPNRARAFVDPHCYQPTPPQQLPGMRQAVMLLKEAAARQGRIRIWGDFDADGQTATVVLLEALQALGAEADYRLPLRSEGHGFHRRVVDEARRDHIALLLTCDTGIGDAQTVAAAREAGITVLITDHHDLSESLPDADAILSPKMLPPQHPLRELSGVGVAYLLARGLLEGSPSEARLPAMLDLVALGLIADIATQVDEVRYLCQVGLAALRASTRPGLRALMQLAGVDRTHVDEEDVGYQLAPRLNAAGRLADAAQVVDLLATDDAQHALEIAQHLEALNLDRRARTEAISQLAERRLQADPDLLHQPAIILESDAWEPGVLGLVASGLARRYQRPTILIAHRSEEPSVGSARSIEGVDIHAVIAAQSEILLREGGHPMAAGFAVAPENVPTLRERLLAALRLAPAALRAEPILKIDAQAPARELTLDLARALRQMAPYGPGNPRPVFMLGGAELVRAEDISRNHETAHRRLYFRAAGAQNLAIAWFNARELPMADERVDLALHIGLDHWKGRERLALTLVDWRPANAIEARESPSLVEGRQVIDWRTHPDRELLLTQLAQVYGDQLILWGEGVEDLPPAALSRAALPAGPRLALAILTAPAGPQVLRRLLEQAQPTIVFVMPLYPTIADDGAAFLRLVGGLVQSALLRHDGWLDIDRMAARIGAREEAVRAALRGLAARERLWLWEVDGRWRATANAQPPSQGQAVPRWPEAQARASLTYLLRETAAYRRAFADDPFSSLRRVPEQTA